MELRLNLLLFEIEFYLIAVNFYRSKLEETKLVQKLRVKPSGVNAVALAIGQKVTTEDLVLKVCAGQFSYSLFSLPFKNGTYLIRRFRSPKI